MSKMKDENIRQMNKVYCLNCTEKEEEIDQLQAALAEKEQLPLLSQLQGRLYWKERAEKAEARLREVYEIYAGMEGFIPETAPEGYCLMIIKKMAEAAK